MKSILFSLVTVFFLGTAFTTMYSPVTLDLDSSHIEWKGTKPAGAHMGTLGIQSGNLKMTRKGKLTGSFIVDMQDMECTDLEGDGAASLVGHLQNEDFFDVSKFPTASFNISKAGPMSTSTRTKLFGAKFNKRFPKANANYLIKGDLTIKGITKEIVFPARVDAKDGFHATGFALVNRTDYGVNYGSKSVFKNLKDKFIHDEMELKIHLHGK